MNSFAFSHLRAAMCLGAVLLLLQGCATDSDRSAAARPGSGLAEYLDLVARSRQAVDATLDSLNRLNIRATADPEVVVLAFSEQVDRLEAGSVRVRARAQAMQARGDAYFENWHQNMASVADPRIRASAEQHRPDLQQSFAAIKQIQQQARDSFQLFLAGLRKLRSTLETNPSLLAAAPTQELAQVTRQHGIEVQRKLDAIAAELRKMTNLLLSPDATAAR